MTSKRKPVVRSLDDIAKLRWVGNHHADSDNFAACHRFLIEQACAILDVMSEHGMGVKFKHNEQHLKDYLG